MNYTKTTTVQLLIILILSFTAKAQEISADSSNNALLWKIERPDMPAPSYLFGTVHLIPEKDFFFTDSMQSAFDKSGQLILEIDINIPIFKQLMLAKDIYLPNKRSLEDYMSEQAYRQYRSDLIDSLQISETTVNMTARIKPIFASGLILNELLEKPVQYEQFLNNRASDNKIPVKGLETIDYQMEVVNNISIEEQIEMLAEGGNAAGMKRDYDILIQSYKEQDIQTLSKLIESEEFSADTQQQLLSNRNTNWIPIIEKEILKTPSFIAVGAGHLAGKAGIIQLLKEEGFTLSPIK
jgi:uncharacterized protein YbaP (TraB family)